MHHWYDAFVALKLVPLVTFNAQLVLACSQWANIPSDVITPTDCLHPMHTACVHPHEITRSLNEAIYWYVVVVQVLQHWPPRSMQVIDVIFLTKRLNTAPVCIWYGEPFTISWTNVNVYGAEVVVLLVSRRSRAWHFHVQLDRVHSKDYVTHVRQHIRCGHYA